ncbi:PREDICTED: wiskott-Aldrich syndrome protein family member 1-like [Galeopterus variegatus]|uniref:Wiskott-Aldrich syndrome protein family member 1-like n=1 Tax=Galeopterus variegatus TaxID=482537 RepID=A0ABM0RWR8_GALVR|nr:PREDICTED: wiskott-Aldrich syndrome protein family member 1-like [Galeopterus variegatus]
MSVNEEKDERHSNQPVMPRKIQDELVNVIQTSLNNIAAQVSNLNKYAEDLFGKLSKDVDGVSCRLTALQEHIIQLTDNNFKDPNKELSLKTTESRKTFESTTQTQQVCSFKPLPVKMCEKRDACVQTSPLNMPTPCYQDDTEGLKIYPDTSHCFELCKDNIIAKSKEQKGGKLKQKKKHLDHPKEPESMPQSQLIENEVSVKYSQAACEEVSHSYVNQPTASTSFSFYPFSEIGMHLTRAVGKALSSPLHLPVNGTRDLKNSLTYVSYGTGRGKEFQPEPKVRLKTEVFVSPTAPPTAPPLPPNWLALSRASKMENTSSIIHFPSQLPSPVFRAPAAASPLDCLQTTPEAAFPIIPRKTDFSPPVPEPFQYYQLTTDNTLLLGEDQRMSPPLSPFPVTSHRIETEDTDILTEDTVTVREDTVTVVTVTDLVGCASVTQSPPSLVFPSTRSSFAQSSRPSVAKSQRPSVPSTPRSSLSPATRYLIPPLTRSSIAPLPRSSTPQTSRSSVPLLSACPHASRSSVPSPKCSFTQSPRSSVATLSRRLDGQSSRFSVAPSGRSSAAQSAKHLIPPQTRCSSLKSTRSFRLQSLLAFVQSPPSCILSPQALTVSQSSAAPVSPDLKLLSTSPIFSKARSTLMEAIRKGVPLRKTKDQCVVKPKM